MYSSVHMISAAGLSLAVVVVVAVSMSFCIAAFIMVCPSSPGMLTLPYMIPFIWDELACNINQKRSREKEAERFVDVRQVVFINANVLQAM